ncbi:MAG TPA: PIG-L family deacetylase [Terriglobia bacterium]|nr:PIG-L family deacetylase [Terriglobia bacterium]
MIDDRTAAWNKRYEQCLRYVQGVVRAVDAGKSLPLGPSAEALVRPVAAASEAEPSSKGQHPAKVVYCAPHPDDESLSGVLALRLSVESGARVTNVAITLGSDVGQRGRRLGELESACRALGFKLVVPTEPVGHSPASSGFENVNLTTLHERPAEWAAKVDVLKEIFDREQPDVVFAPHAEDFNTTHIGTHWLVVAALGLHLEQSGRGPVTFVQTEFWHQLAAPNLMVGVTPETVATLLIAACEHGGEMTRNPYHLLAPARMMDNVRRGSEVVGGQGAAAQHFTFAEIYRVAFVSGKEIVEPLPGGAFVGPTEKVDAATLAKLFRPKVD